MNEFYFDFQIVKRGRDNLNRKWERKRRRLKKLGILDLGFMYHIGARIWIFILLIFIFLP